MGRWLSTEAVKRDIQVLVATHDRDFLLGLLDGGEHAVLNIVRLTRAGNVNHFRQLPESEVSSIWADPVLRYSNVLHGLFYRVVAICEGDADCRFYGAVLDQLSIDEGKRVRADDVLFVPSGGKQRVATMAKALSRLGVTAAAIVDFDMLKSRSDVRGVVDAVGATWTSQMDEAYVTFTTPVNGAGLWDALKHQGLSAVPAGEPFRSCQWLLGELASCGVLVVPVGEMEGFERSIGTHGAGWVSTMLEQGGHRTCVAARDLVSRLL